MLPGSTGTSLKSLVISTVTPVSASMLTPVVFAPGGSYVTTVCGGKPLVSSTTVQTVPGATFSRAGSGSPTPPPPGSVSSTGGSCPHVTSAVYVVGSGVTGMPSGERTALNTLIEPPGGGVVR